MNKRSQEFPILIILPDFENCKGFQSTFMPNQCENPSLHKGCAALVIDEDVRRRRTRRTRRRRRRRRRWWRSRWRSDNENESNI